MWSVGEILLCREASLCSGTVAVLLIASKRTGVEWWWNVIVLRGNSVFRNCCCTVESIKEGMCGVVVMYCCVERHQCVQELWLYCWLQQRGQLWSGGGEILFCGEATVCSGTVALLLIAAKRTGVEWWWSIVAWRGNRVFRNCCCTVDCSKEDNCGVVVVKYCSVERQQCVQELWLYCW